MEELSLAEARGVLEFELNGTSRRLLLDGDPEFDVSAKGVARVFVGGDTEERGASAMGLVKDSSLTLDLPSSDLESEEFFEVELRFFTGESPLVLIGGPKPLPRESLLILLDRIERTFREADLDYPGYLDLGKATRGVALTPLRLRILSIEQSVRDALDDERFTGQDYEALQRYPARLAMVERMSKHLHDSEPIYRSFEPEGRFPRVSLTPEADFFFKWAGDVEQEARDSTARMSGLISSQQIILTQRQAGDAARFQRLVTIVGAAVLVPGLVAAVFGANVGFRGRNSTGAFWAMLLLMAGSGLFSYAAIRVTETGLPADLTDMPVVRWFSALSTATKLAISATTGGFLVILGAIVLVASG